MTKYENVCDDYLGIPGAGQGSLRSDDLMITRECLDNLLLWQKDAEQLRAILQDLITDLREQCGPKCQCDLALVADRAEARLKGLTDE